MSGEVYAKQCRSSAGDRTINSLAKCRRVAKRLMAFGRCALANPELYDLLVAVTSPASPDGARQIHNIQRALAMGRRDIAEALADRMARGARRAAEAKPGVDPGHPRYDEIRASLAERAAALQKEADEAAATINAGTEAPVTNENPRRRDRRDAHTRNARHTALRRNADRLHGSGDC